MWVKKLSILFKWRKVNSQKPKDTRKNLVRVKKTVNTHILEAD